jgi:hypothetical protein
MKQFADSELSMWVKPTQDRQPPMLDEDSHFSRLTKTTTQSARTTAPELECLS